MSFIKNQRTIAKETSCVGIGLHTGVESKITFKPAPEDFGIRFKRMDVEGCPEIKADIDHVVDISRGTTIEENGVRIHTVEHALATCVGIGLDNVMIELSEKEPPVMDGSAIDFVEALLKAGVVKQNVPKNYLHIDQAIGYSDPKRGVDIHIMPSDQFRVTFMLDYEFKTLGTQFTTMDELEKNFATEIAPARTFCFLSEVEHLKEEGLIKGGNIDNAVVIVDKKIDELESIRSSIVESANDARDYLNWFEATRIDKRSNNFTEYQQIYNELMRPLPSRKDELSEYLDELDKEFKK